MRVNSNLAEIKWKLILRQGTKILLMQNWVLKIAMLQTPFLNGFSQITCLIKEIL